MTAKGLLNALLATYEQTPGIGAVDLLIHAADVVMDLGEDAAAEWVAEELQDRRASRG